MYASVYLPPDGVNTYATKVTDITYIPDYRYKRPFVETGEFSMTVIDENNETAAVREGMIMLVFDDTNDDSLIITEISRSENRIVLMGYDLKFLLTQRVTLFPPQEIEAGTYGYDCRTGSTGSIIEGYVDYNLCDPDDPQRKMPGVACMGGNVGIQNDSYMSRLQLLNVVVEALCKNAGIGYFVSFNPERENTPIWITVEAGMDRRSEGYAFGKYFGNVSKTTVRVGNGKEKNTIWAVNGTGVDNATVTAVHTEGSARSGFDRKETVAEINCETEDVEIYAKHAAEGLTRSVEFDIDADGQYYGQLYNVGDIVRAFDDGGGEHEVRIAAVEKQYSGGKRHIKLYFTDYEAPSVENKVLDSIVSKQRRLETEIITQKLDGGGKKYKGNQGISVVGEYISLKPATRQTGLGGVKTTNDSGMTTDGYGTLYLDFASSDDRGGLLIGDGLEAVHPDVYNWETERYVLGSYQNTQVRISSGLEYVENDTSAPDYSLSTDRTRDLHFRGRAIGVKLKEKSGIDFDDNGGLGVKLADNGGLEFSNTGGLKVSGGNVSGGEGALFVSGSITIILGSMQSLVNPEVNQAYKICPATITSGTATKNIEFASVGLLVYNATSDIYTQNDHTFMYIKNNIVPDTKKIIFKGTDRYDNNEYLWINNIQYYNTTRRLMQNGNIITYFAIYN